MAIDYSQYTIESQFNVKDKTAFVTGGGTGIGRAIATSLVLGGAKVFICGRREDIVDATAAELNEAANSHGSTGTVIALSGDVSTKQGCSDLYDKLVERADKLDFLVNNAGYSSNWRDTSSLHETDKVRGKLLSLTDKDFADMTAVHVGGSFFLSTFCEPLFQKSANPSICMISSMAAESMFRNKDVCEYSYAQSKAAQSHMRGLLASAFRDLGIRVNTVTPGLFPSQLTTDANGDLYSVMKEQESRIPKGRAGTLPEIAGVVHMLASPAGNFLNDIDIRVDGGWLAEANK